MPFALNYLNPSRGFSGCFPELSYDAVPQRVGSLSELSAIRTVSVSIVREPVSLQYVVVGHNLHLQSDGMEPCERLVVPQK